MKGVTNNATEVEVFVIVAVAALPDTEAGVALARGTSAKWLMHMVKMCREGACL